MLLATMMVPFATYVVPLHGLLIQMQETFHVKMVNTYQGMMLPFTVWPFGIFLMRQAMFSVPDELIDAAKIDGASTLGIFWRVVVPLVQSQTFALAIYSFIFRYDDLLWPLVVATNEKMYPVAVGLMEFIGFYFVEYGLMMAASTAAIVPVVVIYIFLQQYILQGIAITGLKG
jgi:ABC-type glycerol-3-phosphate transport system permease component